VTSKPKKKIQSLKKLYDKKHKASPESKKKEKENTWGGIGKRKRAKNAYLPKWKSGEDSIKKSPR